MRLFFLLLFLVNTAFFAWQYGQGGGVDGGEPASLPPAVDSGMPSLTLLSERESRDEASAVASRQPPREVEQPPVKRLCATLGPYVDRERAEAARASAVRSGMEATVEETQAEQHIGYWVRMPRELSIQEARHLLAELSSKGIRDVAIVPLEEKRYALSLGVFSREDTMQQRRRTLLRLGYEPEVIDRYTNVSRYMVSLTYEGRDEEALENLSRELIEQPSQAEFNERVCR